jgi:acyl transferase domain-containing protein/acyl carrier protein/NAD(P)-dependent dehydrogenase (short-subunit alcohol dehydrogenase family)
METKNKAGHHKIAIIGTSSMFPGALNTKEFWLNILAERDFIKDVPETHWLKEDFFDPDDKTGDKIYCQKGGFLDNVSFDPVEFGMPPNLLTTTDTVQLLSLIVARDTLADTVSYVEGKVNKERTSVILGVAAGTELFIEMASRVHKPEWVDAMRKQGLPESKIDAIKKELNNNFSSWNENTFPGLLGNVVSGRIANRFDFNGTNCVIDAACASSLAAVKMAIQELQLCTTDMAITGGSDALNDISMYMCFNQTTALSPSQDCRPFSDKGDGTVLGEGIAMMALKRLEDAERDGDRIHGVISSIGSASDGKSGSIYAPDSKGQSRAINRAYEDAGFNATDVGLIEAHGTGTMAGDFQEFGGLTMAFGETTRKQYCALGSVKSMIGHTKSAAGAASMIKATMALNNKILPPTIKIDAPNPKLNLKESPFYLNTKARPWINSDKKTRKAGVSSMGFGGTNFHVALEEYDQAEKRPNRVYNAKKELIVLGGKSKEDLLDQLSLIKEQCLIENTAEVAKSSQLSSNDNLNLRLVILGETSTEIRKWIDYTETQLGKGVDSFEVPNSVYFSSSKKEGKLAYLFAGQGSQYLNMGIDLLMQYDVALNPWDLAIDLKLDETIKLNDVVYPIPVFSNQDKESQQNLIIDTQWAQPSIGTLSLSHLNLLSIFNVKPDVVAGHSYGEIASLYAAGVITSMEDLIQISRKRGELMAEAGNNHEGSMTAVFASISDVEKVLSDSGSKAVIAGNNSPSQTVISGPTTEIIVAEEFLNRKGVRYSRLNVSTAFHSEVIAESSDEFKDYLKGISFGKQNVPIYSNTTGKLYPNEKVDYTTILSKQLASPVYFETEVNQMYNDGVRTFLEIGPNKVLSNFVKDILKDKNCTIISMDLGDKVNSKDALWSAIGQLWVAGISISFDEIWNKLDVQIKTVIDRKPSIATVEINGANYGKPYPPVGGYKNLPKKNPEIDTRVTSTNGVSKDPLPVITNSKPNGASVSINNHISVPAAEPIKYSTTSNGVGSISAKPQSIPPQKTKKINNMSNEWFKAFEEMQRNTLDAQKGIQNALAESHRLFLETSQIAFQQLGNIASNNPYVNENQNAGVVETRNFERTPQIQPIENTVVQTPAPRPTVSHAVAAPKPAETFIPKVETVNTPVVSQNSTTNSVSQDFENTMLEIVAEKTGYPKEILDLNTDLESGLGIDSIKRVEILSALQEVFPELKQVDTAKLAAMNTLGEILDFSKSNSTSANSSSVVNNQTAPVVAVASNSSATDISGFEDVMLEIVAEKTGYPKEILDLGTDLESGLGIDSIKRVEILSALQEKYPALKEVDTAKLAAMNTLGEILDFANAGQSDTHKSAEPSQNGVIASEQNSASTSDDFGDFENIMLEIVAEKTGYPKEILDLTTDLESGLGIDSIKRVEILSALQEKYPALKQVDTAKLAAMNTLGEILNFANASQKINEGGVSGAEKKKFLAPSNIHRYVVTRNAVINQGFSNLEWKNASKITIINDDRGIAKELAALFKNIKINAEVVNDFTGGSSHVVNLKPLNSAKNASIEQLIEVNKEAFQIARTVGKDVFGKKGMLVIPFDNGVYNNSNTKQAWSGGISALAKTASLEWPEAYVQSINIDCADKNAKHLATEVFNAITSGGIQTELEIDEEGKLFTLESTIEEIEQQTKSLNDGDTIIVSGGAKGVTAACLIELSERKKLNIGILGRTKLESEPAYLQDSKTDAELKGAVFLNAKSTNQKITPIEVNAIVSKVAGNREINQNIQTLTNNGCTVQYLAVDIANANEVNAAISSLRKQFGKINGIVHAAGVLADKYIHEKTDEQFNKVFTTKIDGFVNLLEATAKDNLSHICCFSSVAARLGNVGQVDYAMANEILNKVCIVEQKRRGTSCLVKSMNWGPWDGGMVSEQLKNHFNAMGVDLIPLDKGAEMFADEMEDSSINNVEIVIGGTLDTWANKDDNSSENIHKLWIHRSNSDFLDSHRIEGNVIVPMMMANEWSMKLAKSLYPKFKITEVKNLKVFKGIQLENFDTIGDILNFNYSIKRVSDKTEVEVKIQDNEGKAYYAVTVVLGSEIPHREVKKSVLTDLKKWSATKKDIYKNSLFHGPDFQVIEKLEGISESGCTGLLKINQSGNKNMDNISHDLFLYDGGIQMAILAMGKWTGNKSSLPLGYESMKIYEVPRLSENVHCELNVTKKGTMDSVWNLNFKNDSKELLAEMTGLRMYMYQAN